MNRRTLLKGMVAGVFILSPVARAFAKELLSQNGAIKQPSNIHKVFAAGPPAAVFLYTLVPEKLLGWPSNMTAEALQFIHPRQQQLPFTGRLAGRGSTVSLETLLVMAPDIIVDVGNAGETHRSEARRVTAQTGITTLQIEGLLAATPQQFRQAGRILGVEPRAELLAKYSEKLLNRAAEFAQTQSANGKRRARIYTTRSNDGLETGLAGSIHSEVIELLGCHNVASAPGHRGVARVSLEQVLAWQPDYIITQDPEFIPWVKAASHWQSVNAVQEDRVYCASRLPFGWLDGPPGVNRLLGILWLMALLENRLEGEQLAQEVAEFFQLFYRSPVDPGVLLQ